MKVIYLPLSEAERAPIRTSLQDVYLDGECFAFAVALHRALGWRMMALYEGETVRHVFVQNPANAQFWDARGPVPDAKLGEPFGIELVTGLQEIEEAALVAIRPVSPVLIAQALWKAQTLWPELEWKAGPLPRYREFLDKLAELCTLYRVAIFAPFETMAPVITQAEGTEEMVLMPSANGPSYTFNQRIP